MIKLIKKNWEGKEKLWKIFWIYNFLWPILLPVLLNIIFFAFMYPAIFLLLGINESSQGVTYSYSLMDLVSTTIGIVTIAILLTYTVWALVSLWRSAFNSTKRIYGYLARIWVISQLVYLFVFPAYYLFLYSEEPIGDTAVIISSYNLNGGS